MMDLIARITRALDERRPEPGEFERAACALLQAVYPGLSAVEGGNDFGRDGDIYFPLQGSNEESRGRLMVTTGDPVENMRTGLQRLAAEHQRVDLIVMACSQEVSARTRRRLDRLCMDRGLQSPHVFARTWLVGQLVRNPVWRERLTGVRGRLGSLMKRPLQSLANEGVEAERLIGRDRERDHAQELVDSTRDFVLIGQPGAGKTRLMVELRSEVLFLQPSDAGQVVDDLITAQPAAVVVDDAHMHLSDIDLLRRARHQEDMSFSIIATTWPDRATEVRDRLPRADEVVVAPLERGSMDELLRSVGVTGHRARQSILVQARGRPGWALALCTLLLGGDGYQVATGQALVANVEKFLLTATTSEAAVDVLACVAVLGDVEADDLQRLAPLVGVPAVEINGLMFRLAHNGLLERSHRGWRLQPALRGPLIARWFFTLPARRPLSTVASEFAERSTDLVDAVLGAAQVGSQNAVRLAREWAAGVAAEASPSGRTLAQLATYATLNGDAAQQSTEVAINALAADPEDSDAYALIVAVVRQHALPDAVMALLDAATSDTRPPNQYPEHPLRVLVDTAKGIDPDGGSSYVGRERIVSATLDWLSQAPTYRRWVVAAEAIAGALSPDAEGTWSDPGAPDTLTMARGIETASNLRKLIALWPRVTAVFLAAREDSEDCSPQALAALVDLSAEWLGLGRGFSPSEVGPTRDQMLAGAEGSYLIMESLRSRIQQSPGLALRANRRIVEEADDETPAEYQVQSFEADRDLVAFCQARKPRSSNTADIHRSINEAQAAVVDLAEHLAALGPTDGTNRFVFLLGESTLAGDENAGATVAHQLTPHITDPASWYVHAREANVPLLMHAALTRGLELADFDLPCGMLADELHDPRRRNIVISSALSQSAINPAIEMIIDDLSDTDTPLLEYMIYRGGASVVAHRLLVHPVRAIAAMAAVQFGLEEGAHAPLPEEWREVWRAAFLGFRGGDGQSHSSWQAKRILAHLAAHDPGLAVEWYERRLAEQAENRLLLSLRPHGCDQHVRALPSTHRERLVRTYVALRGLPRIGPTLLAPLLGHDEELVSRLLDEGVLSTSDVLNVIDDDRKTVETLGELLLERGVQPADIAEAATPASALSRDPGHVRKAINYFQAMQERIPRLTSVARAGIARQEEILRDAEAREHQARIRGDRS